MNTLALKLKTVFNLTGFVMEFRIVFIKTMKGIATTLKLLTLAHGWDGPTGENARRHAVEAVESGREFVRLKLLIAKVAVVMLLNTYHATHNLVLDIFLGVNGHLAL